MNILVLDALVSYINPTRNLTPVLLSNLGDVAFFGPGYSSKEELERGIEHFVEKTGPYDVVVHTELAHPSNIFSETAAKFNKDALSFFMKGYAVSFSEADLSLFWKDANNFLKIKAFHVSTLFQYDFQGMGSSMYEYLSDNFDLLIGLGTEFWSSGLVDQQDFAYKNTPYWNRLLDEKLVHSLGHFVSANEFCFSNLDLRKHDWSVLGVSYPSRKRARDVLKKARIRVYDGRGITHSFKAVQYKLNIQRAANFNSLRASNERFRDALWRSRASYTCGSGIAFPIRKFFEIPAAGAILVCDPCHGLEALGFVDGVSCIVAQPNELPDVDANLRREPEKAQAIARRGQELILKGHTLDARSRQIRDGLDLLIKDEFYGSYWEAGELKYKGFENSRKVKS